MFDDEDFGVEPDPMTGVAGETAVDAKAQRRVKDAERKRKERRDAKLKKEASATGTLSEFWETQRAQLSPDERASFESQQEKVLDQKWWMKYGVNVDPSDEDYVSMEEGVTDLVKFIHDNPCVRLTWSRGDLPHTWPGEKFWAVPEMMEAIISQGYTTEVYAKYGYWVGLEDVATYYFLNERAKWSHSQICKLLEIKEQSK